VRSTRVPTAEALRAPLIRSPSQWPGTMRAATSGGRRSIEVMSDKVVRLEPRARQAPCVALAQQGDELGAQRAAGLGVDGAIDGLVRDLLGAVHGLESAGNLLGRPAPAQAGEDHAPQVAPHFGA